MNIPKKMGRYVATPTEWRVGNSEYGNNLPEMAIQFALSQYLDGNDWIDVSGEQLEITGYFNLVKTDGQINDFNRKALSSALGWKGASFKELADNDWSQTEVQITVENDTYNNKTTTKVRYINPRDWVGGGLSKTDPNAVQSLDAKYGSMLRALGGGSSQSPATGSPASAPAKSENPHKQLAWKEFCVKSTGLPTKDARVEAFKEAVEQYFGTVEAKAITSQQWQKFSSAVKDHYDIENGFPIEHRFKKETSPPFDDDGAVDVNDIKF